MTQTTNRLFDEMARLMNDAAGVASGVRRDGPHRSRRPFCCKRIFKMATTVKQMKAAARSRAGKGAARAERRAGRVPGVIYGDGKPPLNVSVDHADLKQRIYAGRFLT